MTHVILALVLLAQTPDRGEVITGPPPAYQGQSACPILPQNAVHNEGGSDGAGLCVPSSVLTDGIYQGVPGLNIPGPDGHVGHGSRLWLAAKSAPGGYYDNKLASLVSRTVPGEKWASYYGRDRTVLDRLSRDGYPIAATMNTGKMYGWKKIAHMISLLYYRIGGWACVLDNNFTNQYSWMPANEYDRRWLDDSGNGWAWTWLRRPTGTAASSGALLLACAGAVVLIVYRNTQEVEHA